MAGREHSVTARRTMRITIAVDALGADRAPKPEVEGAILAARHSDVEVLLVGKEDVVRAELRLHPAARDLPIHVVHASERISMQEKDSPREARFGACSVRPKTKPASSPCSQRTRSSR